tara:strand:+ start:675 stop:1541 length:867 start_codon:yes stop_codon:yes gene_type:complete
MNVVSFSGGRTSAYLVYLMEQMRVNNSFEVEYIFMDTGAEHPETYTFVRNIVKHWKIKLTCLRSETHFIKGKGNTFKVVGLDEIGPDLKPFADMAKKYGMPSVLMPHCTGHLKTIPFKKYCEQKYGKGNYITWLGIRADEPRRLKKLDGFQYIADISDFTSDDVLYWWKEQIFDLGFDINSGWMGNCVFCHKKSPAKIALAMMDEPEMLADFEAMISSKETRQLGYVEKDKIYRKGFTTKDIQTIYEETERVDIIARLKHSKRFDTGSCSESCETFGEQMDLIDIINE